MKKLLFLVVIISIFMFSLVAAENTVCCEETKLGEFCQYVPEGECTLDSKKAPTSCDNTFYCKPGCCIDASGEGYCYANYPKAMCESKFGDGAKFNSDSSCEAVPECSKGCCIIGTQASYITEVRCKKETEAFAELAMDFRPASSEAECLKIAHTADMGCCVSEDGTCTFVSDAECDILDQEVTLNVDNETKTLITGFYKNKYCSQIGSCSCAASNPKIKTNKKTDTVRTGCLAGSDDVFYFDSCGNPEGIVDGGDCDYAKGTICGDSDGDGEYSCESIECTDNDILVDFKSETDYVEAFDNGLKNGESWCLYDYSLGSTLGPKLSPSGDYIEQDLNNIKPNLKDLSYASREPVGSRHYRAICINGKQFVEPCEDYRKEFCVQGYVEGKDNANTYNAWDYTESRCVDNRWQYCVDECNTATADMDEVEFAEAQEEDMECCVDTSQGDCSWVGGKCVPRVGPGTKFWEGEGTNNCEKAGLSCSFTVKCEGWDRLFTWGSCEPNKLSKVLGGTLDVVLGWSGPKPGWYVVGEDGSKKDLKDVPCFKHDFIQASNNLCRSYGDCGASYNLEGDITYEGFDSTSDFGEEFDSLGSEDWKTIHKLLLGVGVTSVSTSDDFGEFMESLQIDEDARDPDWTKGSGILDYNYEDGRGYDGVWKDFFTSESFYVSGLSILSSGALGYFEVWPATFGKTFLQGVGQGFSTKLGSQAVTSSVQGEVKGILQEGIKSKATVTTNKGALSNTLTSLKSKGYGVEGIADQVPGNLADNAVDETINKMSEGIAEQSTGGAAGTSTLVSAVNVYMWAKLIYDVGNTFFAETETLTIDTTCAPWSAPINVDKCELCNPDYYLDSSGNPTDVLAFKACSEYRCKSYGVNCGLINKGTDNESCVSLSQFDVNSPAIEIWEEGMPEPSKKYDLLTYGFEITEEIPIYEKVTLAIQTDEPAQCKMSFNHSVRFDDMDPIYFGSTLFEYYHMQSIFYPASKEYTEEGLDLVSGGEYTVYVRCVDAAGNANEKDYAIKFKIGSEPDMTAPVIEGTSVGEEVYLTAGTNETELTLYVNEPSNCRWALTPLSYEDMSKDNECKTRGAISLLGNYECDYVKNKKIKGLSGNINDIKYVYFKCIDSHGNTNQEPFALTLRGSEALNITYIGPEGEMYLDLDEENVTLEVTTEGGASGIGEAECRYTQQESKKNYIKGMDDILDNSVNKHSKILTGLSSGKHIFYVGCEDVAGNVAYAETEFSILSDEEYPKINKYYWSVEGVPHLVFEVSELANCQYSSEDFEYGQGSGTLVDGIVHETAEEMAVYYVKCMDSFDNVNSEAYRFVKF